ncbi:MAG TPA: hypothetical protein VNK49_05965 [Anaerolineales bacterium]|nr:hypothetical protein [Anaerolineales bacterium]
MVLKPQPTWHKESLLWLICLTSAFLIGAPVIVSSIQENEGLQTTTLDIALNTKPYQNSSDLKLIYGQASLDLNLLAQVHSIDEADNLRWSLIRRSVLANEVFDPASGVDWIALRRIHQQDTILLPDGFIWSFNETFQGGPGYKNAGGILAGGHCALATVFRAAAAQAGLATQFQMHASPIPGFTREESVNIYWGRDDLLVYNTSGQDLYFIWRLTPDQLEISLIPVWAYNPLPPLPNIEATTVAMVYGHRGPRGWGTLGQTQTVDEALASARSFASRVDEWNGRRPTVIAINPNIVTAGRITENDPYIHTLIAEARRQGMYVMLDVQTGDQDALPLFTTLMDRHLQENVWFDWDLEHTAAGSVNAKEINEMAKAYFQRRVERGFQTPGIFAFYVFSVDQVIDAASVQRIYNRGMVVPIFDGYGPGKINKTRTIIAQFAPGPFGVMEFETRWGNRYDSISAREYFDAFSDALILASQ